jgi:pimeloyl-ACP methyl ester carboxylesterase
VPLTVARHIADLHSILHQIQRTETIRLVGFSWGAMLALTYSVRYPENIDRIILIGCGTFDENSRKIYRNNMTKRMTDNDQKRIKKIEALLEAENDRHKRNELLAESGLIYSRIQSYKPSDDCISDIMNFDEGAFRQTWADAISLQQQRVQPAEFASIGIPVVMIHGDEDPHPGKLIYDSLFPFIKNLRYFGLPRCGHKPWIEQYAKDNFYELLIDKLM